jgi:hypothetical protein
MATWATKRKLTYASGIIVAAGIIIGIPAFLLLYKAPTCSDGIQNEGEQGIDCGGPCRTLCQDDFLSPVVVWASSEEVQPGLYNLGAYVENPNVDGGAVNVPYQFSVFDDQGILITRVSGTMTIPPNRNTLAFIGAVNMGQRVPAQGGVQFEFTSPPVWAKAEDTLSNISISNKQYSEDSSGASLQATITNTGLTAYNDMTVYSVLSDVNGNELAFSKTYINSIAGGASAVAPFTWPTSFNGAVVSEDILPVVTPAFDSTN